MPAPVIHLDGGTVGRRVMHEMLAVIDGSAVTHLLPSADHEVLPGVPWGRFDDLFTPAYWSGQGWQHQLLGHYRPGPLGRTLAEEVAACMLCSHGMPSEVGLAAFTRLRRRGLLSPGTSVIALEDTLREPLMVGDRQRRYRFPHARANALAAALPLVALMDSTLPDRALRDQLTTLPGIGPKTASWIVRNLRASDEVAIIDVHLVRAGRVAGFFRDSWEPSRHYARMETAYRKRCSEALADVTTVLRPVSAPSTTA